MNAVGPAGFPVDVPPRGGTRGRTVLDIVDGNTTAVQRHLRRSGLAGYEPPTMGALLALFETQPRGFVFFDVGANIGLYSALCGLLFEPSSVVAFEPTPQTARLAAHISELNGLTTRVEQVAVGSTNGELPLYLSATSDSSNSMVEGFKRAIGTETVRVLTLDDYVDEHGVDPDVVKMDVEGFEADVVAGARRLLERRRPALVVEVLYRRGFDHGPAIEAALDGLGYVAYRLSSTPTWVPEQHITGERDSADGDWLLVPEPLPDDFPERYAEWRRRIEQPAARDLHRTDGIAGLARGVRRRLATYARRGR